MRFDCERALRVAWVLTDVDGVHTSRQAGVSVCELTEAGENVLPNLFYQVNGDEAVTLVPYDKHGKPLVTWVEVLARQAGRPVLEMYRFFTPDGQAIIDLRKESINVALISGRNSPAVRARAEALGAQAFLGVKEKGAWLAEQGWFDPERTLFVSDNDADADVLDRVRKTDGITIAPADAQEEALRAAEFITEARGGHGVIAEIATALLRARRNG